VSKFSLLPLPEAKPSINCFQALDYFQTGRAHLLLISETPGQKGGALGIVSCKPVLFLLGVLSLMSGFTVEDLIEE
jgi:metal transporter CNNM